MTYQPPPLPCAAGVTRAVPFRLAARARPERQELTLAGPILPGPRVTSSGDGVPGTFTAISHFYPA